MKSRWLTNFLLVMAIGILSLIAHYLPGIQKPADDVYLTTLKQDEIERIQIDRMLLPQLVLVKKDNTWLIDREPPLPADLLQVNSLTRLSEQTVTRSYAVTELDLAQIEMASPEFRITLNQQELAFGGVDPLEGLRYVRYGDRVNLIEDLYKNQLDAVYTRFIRRRLFAENEKITAIKLPSFQIKQTEGKWQVSPETPVSADKLQLFIEAWQQASALNIQKMDLEKTTEETVSVMLAGQEQPVDFIIQTRETELILARPDYGIQYKLGNRGNEFLNLPGDIESNAE
jgi:hypothetical protein